MIPVTPAVISETTVHVDTTAVHVDTMVYGTAVYVDAVVYRPDLLTRVDISDTVVYGSDMTVETAAVETAMPSPSVPSARVGKIRLEEDHRAQ